MSEQVVNLASSSLNHISEVLKSIGGSPKDKLIGLAIVVTGMVAISAIENGNYIDINLSCGDVHAGFTVKPASSWGGEV